MQPFSALADLIVSFIRVDVPMREIDPYRRAGAEAYDLIDQAPPASWAKVAAWNAFLLQVYGDNLVADGAKGRYCAPDLAMFAQRIYQETNVWLEDAHKAQASDAYRFRFVLPHPLPHTTGYRTDEQLRAMRPTPELRQLIGETLQIALDHANEIGQLLALPELIQRRYARR